MSLPDVVSREDWLAARKELLAEEKEMTRQRDRLNARRRRLPMVEIEKDYRFTGPEGGVYFIAPEGTRAYLPRSQAPAVRVREDCTPARPCAGPRGWTGRSAATCCWSAAPC